jgi:hypothetical protein
VVVAVTLPGSAVVAPAVVVTGGGAGAVLLAT